MEQKRAPDPHCVCVWGGCKQLQMPKKSKIYVSKPKFNKNSNQLVCFFSTCHETKSFVDFYSFATITLIFPTRMTFKRLQVIENRFINFWLKLYLYTV